jgi:hypothetical protein
MHAEASLMGARAKAWCLRIHAEASLSVWSPGAVNPGSTEEEEQEEEDEEEDASEEESETLNPRPGARWGQPASPHRVLVPRVALGLLVHVPLGRLVPAVQHRAL